MLQKKKTLTKMSSQKIECLITIDGDVRYEEKKICHKDKLQNIEESKSITRDKRILRLDKIPMERIKPVCDRQRCYENCAKKRLRKKKKNAKNRKQKDNHSKIKKKKHNTRNKSCVNGKTKSGSKNSDKKTKHKKIRPANINIKSDRQNISYTTTSTGTMYIEGLSPISCEESLELSYENISSDSFSEDDVEVRLIAKERTKKRSKRTKHAAPSPIELALNIKRTKLDDPETHDLANKNRYSSPTFEPAAEALRSSTPSNAEDNATVFSFEMDVSIHSMTTVVMSPRVDSSLYSPTTSPSELIAFYNGCDDDDDDEACQKTASKTDYSPTTSPSELIAFYKGCYDDDNEACYKTASKRDYSPTTSPSELIAFYKGCYDDDNEACYKTASKTDYSPTTSPSELIAFYKGCYDDDNEACYKTASKTEYSPTTSPSELIAFYKGCDDDDNKISAVKTEPYDCERNNRFSLSCNLDSEVKTEIKHETKNDINAGHKSVKIEPNNNECKV